MKQYRLGVIAVLLLTAVTAGCGWTTINPGYAGIVVNKWGTNRGVDNYPVKTGMVTYNPFTTTVFEYPTFVQTAQWVRDEKEGNAANEEISFNTKEGLTITADISCSYQLEYDKVPYFYVKFRSDDLAQFTHGFLRNVVRDQFNETASNLSVETIYGEGKEAFLKEVRTRVQKELAGVGVHVEQLGFVHGLRLPEQVQSALDMKLAANQNAARVQNEVAQAEAEARKKVAEAEGQARALLAIAEGQAKANDLVARSVTPQLIEWQKLKVIGEKWDGAYPQVLTGSGAGMLLQLPTTGKQEK